MLRPRTALLFCLLLLVSSALAFAGSTLADGIRGSIRESYTIILLGALLIAAAIGLRQLTARKRNVAAR